MAVQQNNHDECQSVGPSVVVTAVTIGHCKFPVNDYEAGNNDSGYFTPSPAVAAEMTIKVPIKRDDDGLIDSRLMTTPVNLTVPLARRRHGGSMFPASRHRDVPSKTDCQDPSARRSTVVLVNRIVSPHLIGHFIGRRRVDIIRELRMLNLGRVASYVTRSLTPSELHVACQVSRTWRDVCLAESTDRKRLRNYLVQRQYEKENTSATAKLKEDLERNHEPLLLLGETQNRLPNVAEESSVPEEMARFMRFTEEAKNLDVHQQLDKCPRCSSPARINLQFASAECRSTNGCGFVYCIRCRCERGPVGDRHVCDPLSPPRLAEAAAQKSRQDRKAIARKNLRRLLS